MFDSRGNTEPTVRHRVMREGRICVEAGLRRWFGILGSSVIKRRQGAGKKPVSSAGLSDAENHIKSTKPILPVFQERRSLQRWAEISSLNNR